MSDFRSDTVTVADATMRAAMADAEVGDDFYGEDPTVAALEQTTAEMVGTEAAVLVTSGTQANLLATLALSVGDQVLAHVDSDLHRWEAHTFASVGGQQVLGLPGPAGRLDAEPLAAALAAADPDAPRPGLVSLENTHSASGGSVWRIDEIERIATAAHDHGVPVHCDGARLFNAAVASGRSAAELAAPCDVVTVSLYKGLGAPMGSLVCGTAEMVARSRVLRRRLGTTFRQLGHLAAAGLVALGRVDRLARDHALAADLHARLTPVLGTDLVGPVPETNIVTLQIGTAAGALVTALGDRGVRVTEIVPGTLRLVTHRDLGPSDVDRAVEAFIDLMINPTTDAPRPAARVPVGADRG